jgi:hypothetical protein
MAALSRLLWAAPSLSLYLQQRLAQWQQPWIPNYAWKAAPPGEGGGVLQGDRCLFTQSAAPCACCTQVSGDASIFAIPAVEAIITFKWNAFARRCAPTGVASEP